MKKIILLFLASAFSIATMAENTAKTISVSNDTVKMNFPYENFLGTWVACVAPDDTVTIKLEFRLVHSTTDKSYCESIMGAVKEYKMEKSFLMNLLKILFKKKTGHSYKV